MDLPEDKLFRCQATALKETENGGLLVDIDGEEIWIPQCTVDDKSEVYQEGDEGELIVEYWIAKQKGLV